MAQKAQDNNEKELLVHEYIKTRKTQLIDRIVLAYTPLVEHIARRLSFQTHDIPDMTQVGMIGLLKSLDNFKLDKNVTFSTYASANVIGEIRHYMRDKIRIVKIPRRIHDNYSKFPLTLSSFFKIIMDAFQQ